MSAPSSTRFSRWGRRLLWVGGIDAATGATVDVMTDRSITRTLRAVSAFAKVVATYKFRTPETAEEYFQMHQYAADSILHVCLTNEGLYVKMGQGLNAMSHVLPKQYTETLKVLLDSAKPVPIDEVCKTIEEETGRQMEDLFVRFEAEPVASASIAQVHRAWLRNPNSPKSNADGTDEELPPIPVAVKVRKPCIGRQSKWDIYTFQFFTIVVQRMFGLATEWSRKTIVDGLKREMDFTLEAQNAARFRENFKDNPHVYIPFIYKEYSSTRLLVMEWVDAVKLIDKDQVRAEFNEKLVLRRLFDAFGDMVFKHGFVHCDPHAANVLVRHTPSTENGQGEATETKKLKSKNDVQVVLLDFGLAVPETERFRMQYALLFKSLVTRDMETMKKIVLDWGISDAEMFASMQMQKPLHAIRSGSYEEVTREEVRQMQRDAHARMNSFMIDEAKIPRELPLVGRGIDILRGINRLYDSPINRVNMFVKSAVEALGPLNDFEGVQRYLERVNRLVAAQTAASSAADASRRHRDCGGDGSGAVTFERVVSVLEKDDNNSTDKKSDASSSSATVFSSVYDEGAERLRQEQALATQEILQEQNSSLTRRARAALVAFYRAMLFHLVMWNFRVVYHVTRWYNMAVKLLLPSAAATKLHAPTLDDRLDTMESNMRVE